MKPSEQSPMLTRELSRYATKLAQSQPDDWVMEAELMQVTERRVALLDLARPVGHVGGRVDGDR